MELKTNLRVMMAKRNINTLKEIQELTGLSRNAVVRALNENPVELSKLTLKTLVRLCDVLECTLDELIEYK